MIAPLLINAFAKCARAQDDHLARLAFASGIVRCFGEEYVLDEDARGARVAEFI
jgi:hypothetical protein